MRIVRKFEWLLLLFLLASHTACARSTNIDDYLELKGEMTQGSLIRAKVTPGTEVWLDGNQIAVSETGYLVFGFGRDAPLEHQLKIVTVDGQELVKQLTLEKREYRVQKITGISKKIMQPSSKDVARAQKDVKMIVAARKKFTKRTDFMSDFVWPAVGPVTGVYGSQRFYNGKPSRPHYGVDVANPTGSPVTAPAAGIVSLAVPDMFYSGGTIIIDHGYGVSTTYIHMSKLTVKVGQRVKTGDKIGEIGATGRVTGPHLDWRMNWFNAKLDPQLVVPPMPQSASKPKT
jgi:murein DD-endopeptidase MepM/ murein hydrolase activator NlpD